MKTLFLSISVLFLVGISQSVLAQKLTLAHVAIHPGQGMFWIAKDSGLLAKHGFSAEVVLIPGSPRTVQALISPEISTMPLPARPHMCAHALKAPMS
jgi:ABC-type nitrate/sulfonate/bicarbonate transport system substrate-binding protein